MEKLEPLYTVSGNVKWYSCCGKQYGGSSKKKTRTTMWYSSTTSGYIPERIKRRNPNGYLYILITVALFTTVERWKQPKHPVRDEWINQWSSHTIKFHSFPARKEILTYSYNMNQSWGHYAKWKSQSHEDRFCMSWLIWMSSLDW